MEINPKDLGLYGKLGLNIFLSFLSSLIMYLFFLPEIILSLIKPKLIAFQVIFIIELTIFYFHGYWQLVKQMTEMEILINPQIQNWPTKCHPSNSAKKLFVIILQLGEKVSINLNLPSTDFWNQTFFIICTLKLFSEIRK